MFGQKSLMLGLVGIFAVLAIEAQGAAAKTISCESPPTQQSCDDGTCTEGCPFKTVTPEITPDLVPAPAKIVWPLNGAILKVTYVDVTFSPEIREDSSGRGQVMKHHEIRVEEIDASQYYIPEDPPILRTLLKKFISTRFDGEVLSYTNSITGLEHGKRYRISVASCDSILVVDDVQYCQGYSWVYSYFTADLTVYPRPSRD